MYSVFVHVRQQQPQQWAGQQQCSFAAAPACAIHRPAALPSRLLRHRTNTAVLPRCVLGSSSGSTGGRAAAGVAATASRDLPSAMVERFCAVQDPIGHGLTYSIALQEFISSAILAYECGYDEARVLDDLRASYLVRSKQGEEVFEDSECWKSISLVWVTLALCPARVKRWGSGPAVSERTIAYWRGFAGQIVNAYFERATTWLPVERLMVERRLSTGSAQRPELVAEHARMAFETLALVAPQFPSM